MDRQIRRRRVLGSIGTLAAAGLLAGCSTETRERTGTGGDDGTDTGGDGGTQTTGTGGDGGTQTTGTAGDGGTQTTTGTADDSGQPDWPSYLDDANEDMFEDLTGEDEVTVAVENLNFDPTKILIDSGTTVVWEFNTANHNVKPNNQPADDFQGTQGGRMETVAQGETHSETLETTGTYTYFCGPHEGAGMKGGIQVV